VQFESFCYQNIFLTKIVKLGRYLEVESSLIAKEKRGYEIFNFKVKLQIFGIFSSTGSLTRKPRGDSG